MLERIRQAAVGAAVMPATGAAAVQGIRGIGGPGLKRSDAAQPVPIARSVPR